MSECVCIIFFFFKQKTAYEMRISDWSSDLGSSDLYPSTYIDIYGHTDSSGSDSYNQGLSERRAASVADYLGTRGVQRARMATMGYGESQLKCTPETSEADRQCNRRVEIRIAPVTQSDVNAAR